MRTIKNVRLRNYDYSSDGFYFVTICTNYRKNYLTEYKEIIEQHIGKLQRLTGITVDYYEIMPNHLHLIIRLEKSPVDLLNSCENGKQTTQKVSFLSLPSQG